MNRTQRKMIMKKMIATKTLTARDLQKKIWLCLAALIMPISATATVINIEPDDFSVGTDLSNVSSYVTLKSLDGQYRPAESVYASAPEWGFPAPTGNLTFGSFPSGPSGGPGCTGDARSTIDCYSGFAMFFHQPVNWVSLLAINSNLSPSLAAVWSAFDSNGVLLDQSTAYGDDINNFGIPFNLKVDTPNIAALVVGGADVTRAMEFDRLLIQVHEPTTVSLISLGLVGLVFAGRKRKKISGTRFAARIGARG